MKGLRVKYNDEMSGVIVGENSTHIVINFDNGQQYCISRSAIEEKQIRLCANCKHFGISPMVKEQGWCAFGKLGSLRSRDEYCDRWEKKGSTEAQQTLFQ